MKNWKLLPPDGRRETLAEVLKCSQLMGQLLLNRNIYNLHKAEEYLHPALSQLHSPSLIVDMQKAASRITRAVIDRKKIVIFADFDVDGISSGATLYLAMKHYGANVSVYIPHRLNEGYGLQDESIAKLCDEGTELIVSVDCGITALGPAKVAAAKGVELIITDHHEFQDKFPECYAIVHPRFRRYHMDKPEESTPYPNPDLCGAGVAFKVAWALGQCFANDSRVDANYRELLGELLAFTALGTIADCVPLIGENRVIAMHGLRKLPTTKFKGLQGFLCSAGLSAEKAVDGYQVGYCLAPRINAAGRMGHANEALQMLISDDFNKAKAIGEELEKKNKARQATERAITAEALAQAETEPEALVHVTTSTDWHSGVVGIVASRLVDRFHRPALVLVESGDTLHGSGRSIEGFSLSSALHACSGYLERYGGHAMAAGVKLAKANLPGLRTALEAYAKKHLTPELLEASIPVDSVVRLEEIDRVLVDELASMGPFGAGNPRPLLMIESASILEQKIIGKEKNHLMLQLQQGKHVMKALAFGKADMASTYTPGACVDAIVEPTLNEFQGKTSIEVIIREIRISLLQSSPTETIAST